MLEGKFGAYAREVNMAWMWARVKARSFSLGTFEGGFQAFFDALAKHVQSKGATIQYSTPVRTIDQAADGRLSLLAANGQLQQYDRVLVTTSPRLMTQLAPGLPQSYLGTLNNLKSLGAVVAVFALNQPLGTNRDYYWYNMPKSAGFPFLCLCEHTNFAKPEDFGGEHIVYAGDYVAQDDPILSESQDAIVQRYLGAFTRINPAFEPSWVRKSWVFRESYAQPVPFIGHSKNIPATRTPIDGLYFASMSHVYPWDRGTNYALELGRKVAAEMR
jgi:protoporphyrinogen oxidase